MDAIAYTPTTGGREVWETPLVEATDETLAGYGRLVDDAESFPIEIVRWPAQGWRPVDAGSGDQGGVAEGLFEFWWKGDTLWARNNAVGDSYLFGWSRWPEEAAPDGPANPRKRALIWRANYHPDGGQLFHPLGGESFVIPSPSPAMTSRPPPSSPSVAMAAGASTSTRTSGTAPSSPTRTPPASSTAKAVSTPGCPWTSRRNSPATSASP